MNISIWICDNLTTSPPQHTSLCFFADLFFGRKKVTTGLRGCWGSRWGSSAIHRPCQRPSGSLRVGHTTDRSVEPDSARWPRSTGPGRRWRTCSRRRSWAQDTCPARVCKGNHLLGKLLTYQKIMTLPRIAFLCLTGICDSDGGRPSLFVHPTLMQILNQQLVVSKNCLHMAIHMEKSNPMFRHQWLGNLHFLSVGQKNIPHVQMARYHQIFMCSASVRTTHQRA